MTKEILYAVKPVYIKGTRGNPESVPLMRSLSLYIG